MIAKTKPKDFNPAFEVVSCFLQHGDKILLLHRLPHKSQGDKWGAPAGKIDKWETPRGAMIREIMEETGLTLSAEQVDYLGKVYVTYETVSFVYHTFSSKLSSEVAVKTKDDEHDAYLWIHPEEALDLDLVQDMAECIKMYFKL